MRYLIWLFVGLVALSVVANIVVAINSLVAGQPLDYWDWSMLTAFPVSFVVAIITDVRHNGFRSNTLVNAGMVGLAGAFLGGIYPAVFNMSVLWTIVTNVIAGIFVGIGGAIDRPTPPYPTNLK